MKPTTPTKTELRMELDEANRKLVHALNAVTHLAEAVAEMSRDMPRWIPMDERAPEPEVEVLLADYRGNVTVGYRRREGRGWAVPEYHLYVEPNRWMPIPSTDEPNPNPAAVSSPAPSQEGSVAVGLGPRQVGPGLFEGCEGCGEMYCTCRVPAPPGEGLQHNEVQPRKE